MRRNQSTNEHRHDHLVVLDIETIVPGHPADGPFPKWPNHQPVVASLLTSTALGEGNFRISMDSILCEAGDEPSFYQEVERFLPPRGTLVTFNGTGFDVPALALGAKWQPPRLIKPAPGPNKVAHTYSTIAYDFSV